MCVYAVHLRELLLVVLRGRDCESLDEARRMDGLDARRITTVGSANWKPSNATARITDAFRAAYEPPRRTRDATEVQIDPSRPVPAARPFAPSPTPRDVKASGGGWR